MLPEKIPSQSYGMYGYEGMMVDLAISQDNVENMKECVERGFIDKDSKTLNNTSIALHCQKKGAKRCAAALKALGWQ